MSINEQGRKGEELSRLFIKKHGYEIFQADWIGYKNGNYFVFEVKYKSEPFKPPPFKGHGLEIRQIRARLKFYKDKNIRCCFVVFDKTDENKVYVQWLDMLDKRRHHDTKNKIRIYPLDNFLEYKR